jgi:hypothetical protein
MSRKLLPLNLVLDAPLHPEMKDEGIAKLAGGGTSSCQSNSSCVVDASLLSPDPECFGPCPSIAIRRHGVARRPRTSESFAYVANRVLRDVLESRSGEVEPAQMRQALNRTLAALQRDVITDDPALYRALPARIEAGRAADHALSSGRPARCHPAMRRFWGI